ncbi:MAG: hypothetical protein RL468_271 [Pseudomonadota bacterium]
MPSRLLATLGTCMVLFSLPGVSHAQTAQEQLTAANQQAKSRYDSDLKLCADEPSSAARLQCRRDAKTEYDRALAAAKEQAAAATRQQQALAACTDCGKVSAVSVTEKEGEGSAVGMVAGGVAGALLGRQLGGGIGRDLATVAGAAGGAYAGKEIEKKVKTQKVWNVDVQFRDNSKGHFEFAEDPGLAVGVTVKKSGSSIVRF